MRKKVHPVQENGNPAEELAFDAAKENTAPGLNTEEDTVPEALVFTDGNEYEHRAIDRRLTEIGLIRDEIATERKEWIRSHRLLFIVVASVLIIVLIFIGMKFYNDAKNPLSRFISASANNLGSSFSFHITAETNGEALMTYDGTMKVIPSDQRVEIEYKADYTNYSYTNVLYTYDTETYKGNYYNNQWTMSTVTEKVEDFFDFSAALTAVRSCGSRSSARSSPPLS